MKGNRLLFSYDQYMNKNKMALRCPTATPICTSELIGFKLVFRGEDYSAMANIEHCTNSVVPVQLWSISEREEVIMDCFIGWPTLYRKEYITVDVGGEKITALVYLMNLVDKRTGKVRPMGIPTKEYIENLRSAYEAAGLDQAAIDNAVKAANDFRAKR